MTYGRRLIIAGLLANLAACGGGSDSDKPAQLLELSIDICDPATRTFSTAIDNRYFPLPVGRRLVLEGDDEGEALRVEVDVLDLTETVTGVATRVVAETEFKDGALFERTFNYFAQASDGTVCYFGEDVEFFEDGEVVGSEGTWRADFSGNRPGIQMPAAPSAGTRFYQEFAPGVAEDRSSIAELGLTLSTAAGAFGDVIRAIDWNPLEGETIADGEDKLFAADVGLVQDGPIQLVASRAQLSEVDLERCNPLTNSFSLSIDNPYFPLPVGRRLVLEGDDDGEALRLEFEVLDMTEDVAGIVTRVVTETEFKDGELFERTFNYFAQAPDGTVCYFGEDVEFYEAGVLVGSEGTWRADLGANLPGIQMPAAPVVDSWFFQEFAPDVAEDKSYVAGLGVTTSTPAGDFADSLAAIDWNPLDGDSFLDGDEKRYASGVGLVQDGPLLLTSME